MVVYWLVGGALLCGLGLIWRKVAHSGAGGRLEFGTAKGASKTIGRSSVEPRKQRQLKTKSRGRDSQEVVRRAAAARYRGVKIKSGRGACAVAVEMRDTMVLASEAPSLPLAGCDSDRCQCRYQTFGDRREEDRRNPYGKDHGALMGGNSGRRQRPDRRQDKPSDV